MTSIKPPGAPGAPAAPSATSSLDATPATQKVGPSGFDARVEQATAKGALASGARATTPLEPTQAVFADLRAGRITAEQAVERLTDLAVRRAASPSLRPAVEARLRAFIASDPTVRALLKQAGAAVPADPSEQ